MTNIPTGSDSTYLFSGLVDASGVLLGANKPGFGFIGGDSIQDAGKPFWEWWSDNPKSAKKLKEAVTQGVLGQLSQFQVEHTDVDGNSIQVDFNLTPLYDSNNKVTSLVVEFTDNKKIKTALAESEQRFQWLIEFSSDCYWEQDEHYRFTRFSPQLKDHTGAPAESYLGQCRWDFPCADDVQIDWSVHQALLARHESFRDFEYQRLNDAGAVIWFSTSGYPIFDADNNFTGYRGMGRNITEQKHSESVLREAEQQLTLAINISGIGIWEWDMISDRVIWDAKQFELFGIEKLEGSIPLATVANAIHPDDRDGLDRVAQRVLKSGVTALEEFRVVHPDGSIHWLLGGSSVIHIDENRSAARVVGINMDITKSKETEAALRAIRRQLQSSNKTLENRIAERTLELEVEAEHHRKTQSELAVIGRLDLIGQLAGGVAHDFNNLLAIIGGNLELAALHITHEEVTTLISDALKAVEAGADLNRRLLTYAGKQRLSPVKISAADCLSESIHLLERTLGEDILITTEIDSDLWDVFIDASEIQGALINLAVNARDAMPRGGNLTVELRNTVLADGDSELSADATPGEYVGIFVTDTGAGMTDDVRQRALEPFFTTKKLDKGTGLGLSSVYGFVKKSGGFLRLYSTVGQGTTVRLYLPSASDRAVSVSVSEFGSVLTQHTPQTENYSEGFILVVEDDPMVRAVTVKRFLHLGYRVIQASTAQLAIDILKVGTMVDLVFTDIVMPGGMTGYELLDWVTINRKDVKVLLTSGYIDPVGHSVDSSATSNISILNKPYSIDHLAQRVREAMEPQRH